VAETLRANEFVDDVLRRRWRRGRRRNRDPAQDRNPSGRPHSRRGL